MIVVGGSYREICQYPVWDRFFGSGLRAAAAVSKLSADVSLVTYSSPAWRNDIRSSAAAFEVKSSLTDSTDGVSFEYFHPLSTAVLHYDAGVDVEPLRVEGSVVLRFGMVEGTAVVRSTYAVYDPQTGVLPESFHSNGSQAEHLAIVLNGWEAEQSTGLPSHEAGELVLARENAEAVIVKLGPRGAMVHTRGGAPVLIPPYRSDKVFKIGSGDVFSAAFAHYWAEGGLQPAEAADLASRAVAHFVNGHRLPLPTSEHLDHGPAFLPRDCSAQVYLAGPFFTISQRWLVEEIRDILTSMGVSVFSPLHEVGTAKSSVELASGDLQGLESSAVVLAVLDGADPGTLFEVGYARRAGIPVIAFAERMEDANLTMLEGSGCVIEDDFTTALYMTAFEAWSQ
ncbi:PfkB family carbohydrate kinase [Rhizobium sp. IY2]|uniref:PfkB family carbohydrate kinase n=1 Tax=Rhizobium sp. IY2 TaxID=3397853 RepID=UPI0039E199D9